MCKQEKKTDKVIIDVTRSVHGVRWLTGRWLGQVLLQVYPCRVDGNGLLWNIFPKNKKIMFFQSPSRHLPPLLDLVLSVIINNFWSGQVTEQGGSVLVTVTDSNCYYQSGCRLCSVYPFTVFWSFGSVFSSFTTLQYYMYIIYLIPKWYVMGVSPFFILLQINTGRNWNWESPEYTSETYGFVSGRTGLTGDMITERRTLIWLLERGIRSFSHQSLCTTDTLITSS